MPSVDIENYVKALCRISIDRNIDISKMSIYDIAVLLGISAHRARMVRSYIKLNNIDNAKCRDIIGAR